MHYVQLSLDDIHPIEYGGHYIQPRCPYCNRTPAEIAEYVDPAKDIGLTPDDYVRQNEGTYNEKNGHFACTTCYIKIGMPANPYPMKNWVAP